MAQPLTTGLGLPRRHHSRLNFNDLNKKKIKKNIVYKFKRL
jgi:hypothetical protein